VECKRTKEHLEAKRRRHAEHQKALAGREAELVAKEAEHAARVSVIEGRKVEASEAVKEAAADRHHAKVCA
jgi:hypothetical protein